MIKAPPTKEEAVNISHNNSPEPATQAAVPIVPTARIPLSRAVKTAIHFLLSAARILRTQSSDPRLHRVADQLAGVVDLLKKADQLSGGAR
jgi:hypothetical protein